MQLLRPLRHFPRIFHALALFLGVSQVTHALATPEGLFALDLPATAVPDRVSLTKGLPAGTTETLADLEGPGCIKHLWITLTRPGKVPMITRKMVIRIYFDGATTPQVEAPIGDFFGVMHGEDYYDINTEFLAVKQFNGYNCYFEMPFARQARVEIANGPTDAWIYLQVDWHRYPGQEMKESRRFCAQWRREMPTPRYGQDYLVLDADGPGQLIGYVYGVRLIDDADRWSHGGAANLYIDGMGEHPAYLRGIGGEDDFGTSYGGVQHPPESHLYSSMPYYRTEDTGEPRGAQRIVGYRFFVKDPIAFRESLHIRFGSMANDICSIAYWYQNSGSPRRFVNLPDWPALLPATELKAGSVDLPRPQTGSWKVGPLRENAQGEAIARAMKEAPIQGAGEDWASESSDHGFIDFNHHLRPNKRGVGIHYSGKAAEAMTVLSAPTDMTAHLRIAWDDELVLRVNDQSTNLGKQAHFRDRTIDVPLKKGANPVAITLSNERGTNHGGWAFSFRANAPDGSVLVPSVEPAN